MKQIIVLVLFITIVPITGQAKGRKKEKEKLKAAVEEYKLQLKDSDSQLKATKHLLHIYARKADSLQALVVATVKSVSADNSQCEELLDDCMRKYSAYTANFKNLYAFMNGPLKSAMDSLHFDYLGTDSLDVERSEYAYFINIGQDIYFSSGSYVVRAEFDNRLRRIADILQRFPEAECMVEGNTDVTPYSPDCSAAPECKLETNWDLSVKRATTVTRILIDKYHISPSRITAAGKGEFNPKNKDEQNSESAMKLNRRTSIIIMPKLHKIMTHY